MKTFKRKAVILFVSIALFNVALSSIINFHLYKIYHKELSEVGTKFIKKDDNYFIVKTFENHNCKKIVVLGNDNFEKFSALNNLKYEVVKLETLLRDISVFRSHITDISPTRGSPFHL